MRHNRTKFADFYLPPRHRFGVARRPLTCDCNLSWQSDMFLLYIKVGVRRQFDRSWQIFDKVSSISQSREVWILGRPLSATRHSHLWLQLLLTLFTIATFVWNLHISLSAHWWVSFSSQDFLKPTQQTQCTWKSICSKYGKNHAETLQDDDYHILRLAVLDDHEWMVLRRIERIESGTKRLRPCWEIMTDRWSSYRLERAYLGVSL